MRFNLRHLRVFLAVVETQSVTRDAERCHVSQPAVTQALSKIEATVGEPLFTRRPHGLFVNPLGEVLVTRVRRAFSYLDPAMDEVAPRLKVTATLSQLEAMIAVRERENYTLAAHRMGLSQPTVHRSVSQLEREAGRPFFEKTAYGIWQHGSELSLIEKNGTVIAPLRDNKFASLPLFVGRGSEAGIVEGHADRTTRFCGAADWNSPTALKDRVRRIGSVERERSSFRRGRQRQHEKCESDLHGLPFVERVCVGAYRAQSGAWQRKAAWRRMARGSAAVRFALLRAA